MKSEVAIVALLSIATAAMMLSMSGWTDYARESRDTSEVTENLNKTATNSTLESDTAGGLVGGVSAVIGVTVNAVVGLFAILKWVVFMPATLQQVFGLPWWAAYPIGLPLTIVASIGLIAFARGTPWR